MVLPIQDGLAYRVKNGKNRIIYQNYFTIFRKFVVHVVYIRWKQTDNVRSECAITVLVHFLCHSCKFKIEF